MTKLIREFAEQAGAISIQYDYKNRALVGWPNIEKFAELIISECCKYLTDEINRLNQYRAELEKEPQRNEQFINDVDVCIDKCQDNIQGLREHFGVEDEPTNS